jgi:S-adenosylmethionine:tRNA ribosyltransferase-isomerase
MPVAQYSPDKLEHLKEVRVLRAPLVFDLPAELEAGEPPEARGLRRDEVRLLVSRISSGRIQHTRFRELPDSLQAGDILVINTSGTFNAALSVTREDGLPLELHLSTRLPGDLWVVELRRPEGNSTAPFFDSTPGDRLLLPGEGRATLLTPYRPEQRLDPLGSRARLWIAGLDLPLPLEPYLDRYGFPIRYKYVQDTWPPEYYQTVYATEKGSAEMPSAGRAFTPGLITRLVARGVQIAPLVLHTGVASLESHEPPYEEVYRVSPETARVINEARAAGGRAIAVGTTSVRALETVTDEHGRIHPGEGWTRLVITPDRRLRAVDGLLTGLHEPRSTHLAMLAALAGYEHLRRAYADALCEGYLWHEFGDMHLVLP